MSNFLLQIDPGTLDLETAIVKDLLKHEKYAHEYKEMSLKELKKKIEAGTIFKDFIPVRAIDKITV